MTAAAWLRAAAAAVLAGILSACVGTSLQTAKPPAPSLAEPRVSAGPAALMADRALAMRGQPYRYGGAAPGGFDCSGLVAYAAAGAGIRVPRTAQQQFGSGVPVARGELRPGDLVFMHLARKELHVGIAIDAERFVHAPSQGNQVRIDSLDAPPYARGFLGARRLSAP